MLAHSVPVAAVLLATSLACTAAAQVTSRVSVDSSGTQGDLLSSGNPRLSADGRFVVFDSYADNLVSGDGNGVPDTFVRDRDTGTTTRASVSSTGKEGTEDAEWSVISADGSVVAFVLQGGGQPSIFGFDSNPGPDVVVHNLTTGATTLASCDSNGVQANDWSSYPAISADGNFVIFSSYATNLVPNDTNGFLDIFVRDVAGGVTTRASVASDGTEANGYSTHVSISGDGSLAAFCSSATNLVANDTSGSLDVFVHDFSTGETTRVSVRSDGSEGLGDSAAPCISPDGRFVAFNSIAGNLVDGDGNGLWDVFIHDRTTGVTTRASLGTNGVGPSADCFAYGSYLSDDGRFVAFNSTADNLVSDDHNGLGDTFVRDTATGETIRTSVASDGSESDGLSLQSAVSGDGSTVAFMGFGDNLASGDTNGASDIFARGPLIPASWRNYGSGFAGSNGVPSLVAESNPIIGETLSIDLANSWGHFSAALLVIGTQETSMHSSWGGDLLVVPTIADLIAVPASGLTLSGVIPDDGSLAGAIVAVQALESDPGAAKGVSFTPGLELSLGF